MPKRIPSVPRKRKMPPLPKVPKPIDMSKRPVTGKLSLAQVRRDVPENGTPTTRKMQRSGWTGNPRDRAERLYNPKRRPR